MLVPSPIAVEVTTANSWPVRYRPLVISSRSVATAMAISMRATATAAMSTPPTAAMNENGVGAVLPSPFAISPTLLQWILVILT
jgi:hypothetical protein